MTTATTPTTTLENPVLGLRAVVQPADGDVLRSEVFVDPGGNAGPAHVHWRQQERFDLIAGRIAYKVAGRRGVLVPGETLVVPPNTSHTFVNDGDEAAHFIAEFRPALRVEELFAALFALAREGRVDARGLPSPLQAAVLMREFPEEFFYLPRIPVAAQQAIAAPLAAVARRRGYGVPR